MTTRKVAVIGGGASATLLLAHLAHQAKSADIAVDIYDRTGRFGRGVAYSTTHDCHLLNVRASNMSAYHEDKEHFARWAAGYGYASSDFVPRKRYGDYLCEVLSEAERALPVRLIKDDVVSVVRTAEGFTTETATGVRGDYDAAVLASGNVRPLRPATDGAVSGYYDDPWSADFSALLMAKHIALVGSGLTAVDMVLALADEGYKGKIIIFSRNALLPAVHVAPVPFASFLDAGDEKQSPLYLLQKIRQTVRAADVPWQCVIDSLRPHTNAIWQGWDDAQRKLFSRRLLTFWNVHRHRMAPQIGQTVQAMLASGQLTLFKGGVGRIESGPSVKLVNGGHAAVDAVINCLGYRYDERGGAFADALRLGPARFGDLFETTAIPEIRAQSHALAQDILK